MVDEVVAGEGVDELALAAPVCGGDRHELAVAGGGRGELGPGEEPGRVRREQRRRDEDPRIVADARRRDDRGDRLLVAHHEPAEQVSCAYRRHGHDHPERR